MDRSINEQFGNDRFVTAQIMRSVKSKLIEWTDRAVRDHTAVRPGVRASHALEQERGGVTGDDATVLLIEWRGGDADRLATLDRDDSRLRYGAEAPAAHPPSGERGDGACPPTSPREPAPQKDGWPAEVGGLAATGSPASCREGAPGPVAR
ncbi:hypothetical protein [Streptomyces sp. NBC_01767]|uniref:hypothetical protein n=1 Tax=unclassified Streptomyces TaxID=2593676 RepID=UPI000F5B9369|nr:hypothetical protein [Streptomyces sp. NBC_01767]MCX4395660.1 hypothetical protein [Streptomyces sp. NBC_01767]RPK68891.1 hypothetical protein EES42_20090 [Streptomyces sp. ADI95-17]